MNHSKLDSSLKLLAILLPAFAAAPALAADFDMGNLSFSYRGPKEDQHCIKIEEPSEPREHAWHDNYLCSTEDYGLKWSYRGKIKGMECVLFNEPSEPREHYWGDNYLCAPEDYGLTFHFAGADDEKSCVHILEESDPHAWHDNYLCAPNSDKHKVIGYVDRIGSNPVTVDGWACATGHDASIEVQVFVGGPIGEGRVVGGGRANLSSETAVAQRCGTGGSAYRFSVPVTDSQLAQNLGQPVWVHGVSPVKGANLVLENSGKLLLPTTVANAPSVDDPDPYPGKKKDGSWFKAVEDRHRDPSSERDLSESKVIGYVDEVLLSPPSVSGWACLVGSRKPVVVHLYVGGPMGIGKLLGQVIADSASEEAVGKKCETGYRQHRFQLPLNFDQSYSYSGLSVYGYAFSRGEGPLGYHGLSGTATLPGTPK